ncbi:hypothetical protein [Spongiimicrobium salis]|uniref:hypothetical protein n=1 Tax=Spongiimicrobium salis TaxID=1667022 RepID=UPI00374D7EAD
MKINTKLMIMGSILIALVSCTSVNEEDLIDPPVEGIITFEANIQPITQGICNECHSDPPQNGAPIPLVTLENVRSAIENRGLIGRINSNTAPMPPSGLLPVATRELFDRWVEDGFAE